MPTFDLHQLAVNVLDQGGFPYGSTPSGWEQPSFDDSGWSTSANPTLVPFTNGFGTSSVWAGIFPSALPSGVEAVWPTSSRTGVTQSALIRWHVSLPSSRTITSLSVFQPSPINPSTEMYVNGTGTFTLGQLGPGFPAVAALLVTGDNLIAVRVFSSGGSTIWQTAAAWLTWRWVVGGASVIGRSYGQVVG